MLNSDANIAFYLQSKYHMEYEMKLVVYLLSIFGLFLNLSAHAAHMDSKKPFASKENNQQDIILLSRKIKIDSNKSGKENCNYQKFVMRRNHHKRNTSAFHDFIDEAINSGSYDSPEFENLFDYIGQNNVQFRSADSLKPFVGYVVEHYGKNIATPTLIAQLIAHGANQNAINPETCLGALHVAIYQQHEELVEQLVIGKADVNIPARDGRTPLHFACATGNLKIVKYLIAHGADVDARDNNDAAPMHFIVGRSLSKAMPSFLQFPNQRVGKLVNNKYRPQIEARKKIIDFLLENKAEFEPIDTDNKTPYHICCRELHLSLASYLLRKKPAAILQHTTRNNYDSTSSAD